MPLFTGKEKGQRYKGYRKVVVSVIRDCVDVEYDLLNNKCGEVNELMKRKN